MSEQDLLQAMQFILKEELGTVNQRLDTVGQRLDRLEESMVEVRNCVNTLLEWSDKISKANRLPLSGCKPDIHT